MKKITFFIAALFMFTLAQTFAQTIPTTINYQGVLKDAAGNIVPNGNYNITFKIYNVESGGSVLWQETKSVAVENGVFNHQLGSVSAISLPFNTAYWLGITIASGTELTPRNKLGSVPYSMISKDVIDNSINSSKVIDGSITVNDISNDAITSAKITNGTIITEDLANNSVTSEKIVDGTLTATDIGNTQVVKSINSLKDNVTLVAGTNVTLTPSGNNITISSSPGLVGVTQINTGAGLTGGPITTTGTISIPNDGIITSMLQNNAVTTAKIANDAVTSAKISDGTIVTSDLANNSVNSSKIVDASITGTDITSGTITGTNIANTTIGIGKLDFTPATLPIGTSGISDNAVTTAKIANDAVTSAKISDGTISSSDLASSSVTSSKIQEGAISGSKISIPLLLSVPAGGSSYVLSVLNTSNDAILTTVSTGTGIRSQVSGTGTAGRFEGGSSGYALSCSNSGTNKDVVGIGTTATGGGSALVLNNNNSSSTYSTLYSTNFNGSGYAGYFNGKLHVNGTLSKSAGSFRIDHPLNPENKYLYHSFVESPDMMNIYNGNIVLNASGEAIIQLPDWFEVLNKEFRYQLTAIGGAAPNLYIASEVANSQFKIAGGAPNQKVSWQVTGIRHDPYAEKNRIPVEEIKGPEERGKYLNPEVYGLPKEQGIGYKELDNN